MNCAECKEKTAVVPYIVHEADMARQERTIKRLFILLFVSIILLVCSNLAWVIYENQFEDIEVSQDVDTGEGDAYVAGVGDIYGESQANG